MLESLTTVAGQVGVLFALMGVGWACNRTRLLDERNVKGLVELLVAVVTPCVIVQAFQRPFERHLLAGLWWALGTAFAVHALGVGASLLVRSAEKRRECVLRFSVIFSNAGFMGIPLEQALLGGDGVFYGAVYVAVFNLLCWSYGLWLMCGNLKDMRARTLLLNPGSTGIALGLPFFLLSAKLPGVVGEPVRMLADLNTPLAMIVIGYYLAEASFKAAAGCGAAWAVAGLRLVAIPAATMGGLWLLGPAEPKMAVALTIASAAPVAAMSTMLAARYGRDVETSVGLVAGTTLFSMVTMPPLVGLAMWIFR